MATFLAVVPLLGAMPWWDAIAGAWCHGEVPLLNAIAGCHCWVPRWDTIVAKHKLVYAIRGLC